MHGFRGVSPTCRPALVALIAVLFMSVGAASANAGGRDHGSAPGHEKWTSDEGQQSGGHWDSDKGQSDDWQSSDKSQSDTSDTGSEDQGQDCKKNEGQPAEQTGEQGQPQGPPQGEVGGEQGQKGEESQNGEKGEHGKKEEENKGGKTPTQGGPTPTTVEQTPAAVTTPAPVVAPVQAQQTPTGGGEVQGVVEESPGKTGSQGGGSGNRGGRVLASTQTQLTASETGLARTGFDAWQLALLGALCVAGSALLLRRTSRS
jgi:hypothetical protein